MPTPPRPWPPGSLAIFDGEVTLQVLRTESFQVNVASGMGNEGNDSGDLAVVDELLKLCRKYCGGEL